LRQKPIDTLHEGKTSVDEETLSSGISEPDEAEEPDEGITGLPVCLLCTCLGGSVYCDDLRLNNVPPLPKDTTHFYAHKLKKIDLTANEIMSIEDKTFMGLPELEELIIRQNHVSQLPSLPETMALIDASQNNIGSKGIHKEAFKMMHEDTFCNLNNFNYIRNALEDIRLDGNPINLSKTPQAYICLPRIPIGNLV
ncbi:hypothetical protein GOODEAATRI_012240, partial [Goodea atripinnis]